MESTIKIKATLTEIDCFFYSDVGVRFVELCDKNSIKDFPTDLKKKFIWKVIYRHREINEPLKGVYTIEGLKRRLKQS